MGEFMGAQMKKAAEAAFPLEKTPYLAETEGFEPSMRLYTPYSLSRGLCIYYKSMTYKSFFA
jgi:hypothetical protein